MGKLFIIGKEIRHLRILVHDGNQMYEALQILGLNEDRAYCNSFGFPTCIARGFGDNFQFLFPTGANADYRDIANGNIIIIK